MEQLYTGTMNFDWERSVLLLERHRKLGKVGKQVQIIILNIPFVKRGGDVTQLFVQDHFVKQQVKCFNFMLDHNPDHIPPLFLLLKNCVYICKATFSLTAGFYFEKLTLIASPVFLKPSVNYLGLKTRGFCHSSY